MSVVVWSPVILAVVAVAVYLCAPCPAEGSMGEVKYVPRHGI